jgi:arsenate reductase
MITVYHNGECSKCWSALTILKEQNVPHVIRQYLQHPLSEDELKVLLKKLKLHAFDLVRKSEPLYHEQYEGKVFTEEEWVKILADNPILIQRPVVEKGDDAVIAQPPERVLELI